MKGPYRVRRSELLWHNEDVTGTDADASYSYNACGQMTLIDKSHRDKTSIKGVI